MGIVYLEGNWSPSEATFRVGPIMKIIILLAALVAITSAEPGWYGHRRPTYTHPAPPAHPTCACKTIYKTIQKTGETKKEETKCENVPKQVCKDEHKKVCTPVSYGHHKRWKRHSYSHYHSYRPITPSHHAPKSHYSRKSYQPVHKPQPKCHYVTKKVCKREASPGGYGYSHGHYRKHQLRCFHKQEKVCSVEHKQVCTDRHYPVCSTSYKDQCRTTYVTV